MGTFKKAKVVMLPTNQKTKYLMVYSDVEKTKGKLILNGLKNDEYKEYQHLYIISYIEKPDNGDYYIIDDVPELLKNNGLVFIDDSCRKVIATTDTSLKIDNPNYDIGRLAYINLPQPSQQFIEKFVEEYNKGRETKEVLVEYEEGKSYSGNEGLIIKEWLKINPEYNTITIKKVKDNYSREEVIKILFKCKDFLQMYNKESISFDKWIKENL